MTATLFSVASGWSGPDLRLAIYLPAILATGLLAGLPAGLAVTMISAFIVWWAFTAPFFQFKWLIPSDQIAFGIYTIAAGCTLLVAHWCRLILGRLLQQQRMNETITKELEHRGRNIFAVIEGIVQKTLEDDRDRAERILGRVRAIRYANELLTSPIGTSITLADLLLHELAPFGENRLKVEGPVIEVAPETARHLILIVHELATNATKYGALASPSGSVFVTWERHANVVTLRWKEKGGPEVRMPSRSGFGSKLVLQCIAAMSGTISPTFASEGFLCNLTFSLPEGG